jgi:hypothetical protein
MNVAGPLIAPETPTRAAVCTFIEAGVRGSRDVHWFLVPATRDLALAEVKAVVNARGSLTTYDGREQVRASTIDLGAIIVHGELDVVLPVEDASPLYLLNGDAIYAAA